MTLTTEELLPALLRSTGLLALSALAARALLIRLRSASPTLWRIACVLSLVQGVLIVRLSIPLPWAEPTKATALPVSPYFAKAEPQPSPHPTPETTAAQNRLQNTAPTTSATPRPSQRPRILSLAQARETGSKLLVFGWLAGMTGLVVTLFIGYVRFVSGLETRPPEEPAWAEEWSSLLAERRVRRLIPLRMSDDLGPLLCRLPGGYRLIVPTWLWRRLDASERQAILKHELAHYVRGDLWKSLAIRALALPHWFNPLAWWTVRTFDECGEWACDDAVTGPEPSAGTAYARALLQVVDSRDRRPSFGFAARGSSLATRIRRLLQPRPAAEPIRVRLLVMGVLIGISACALLRPEWVARRSRAAEPATDVHGDPLPPGALARLGTLRFRPGDIVERLAYAPDGKTLACWDASGTLSIFDAATGKPLRRHHFPYSRAHAFTYLAGGRSLAIIKSSDDVVHFWDFADGREAAPEVGQTQDSGPREMRMGDDHETFTTFAVSPDGRLLAGGSFGFSRGDRMIRLWDFTTGKRLDELTPLRDLERRPDSILWVGFSPDGRTVYSLSGDPRNMPGTFNKGGKGILYTWDATTAAEIRHFEIPLPIQQGERRALAISHDGQLLAVGTPEKPIHLIRLADGSEFKRLDGLGAPVHALAFSPDGTRLVSGGRDQAARIWDIATGQALGDPIKHRGLVEAVAVAPDSRAAASGGQDNLIRIWDTSTTHELAGVPAHEFFIWSAAVSPDGTRAVTSSWDSTVRIWDAMTGRQRQATTIPGGPRSMALSPDGKILAVSSGRPTEVRLLDLDSGQELRRLEGQTTAGLHSLGFSRDGGRIVGVAGDNRALRLWDVATGRSLGIFQHQERIGAATISPDGAIVAGAGSDPQKGSAGNVIRLWDTATGKQIRELRGQKSSPDALAFSPDGKLLATGSHSMRDGAFTTDGRSLASPDLSDSIHLWDVATGTDLRQFPGASTGNLPGRRIVHALAFTPDGRTLISGEGDGSIVFYDPSNARVRATLRGHRNSVRALSVSTNGKRLVSASTDLTGLVWDLAQVAEMAGAK